MKPQLTQRQEKVFNALSQYLEQNLTAPTFRELSVIVGFPCSDALKALRRKLFINWKNRKSRSIFIICNKNNVKPSLKTKPQIKSIDVINNKTIISSKIYQNSLFLKLSDDSILKIESSSQISVTLITESIIE